LNETNQALKQFIIDEFLSEYGEDTLDANRPLVEDGIIDSLGIFVLVNFIDTHFGILLESDEIVLDNFETLNTLSALVNQKMAGAANNRQS
jgi:acyl carrier protein